MAEQPNVYIVARPNGAGKSTFARLFEKKAMLR
jgi:predicted ABC-type ATPase